MIRTTEQFVCLTMALVVLALCSYPAMAVGLDPVPEFYGADVEADVQRDSASSPAFDQYIYTYTIRNPSSNKSEIWSIKIDISEPVERFDLPTDPTLQLGATTKHFSDYRALLEPLAFPARRNVIPIGQKVPTGWIGGFGRDGFLSFASEKRANNIQSGQSQGGFTIVSRRVPTLREIQVIPNLVPVVPNHDTVTEEERDQAADVKLKLLFTTFTLGPSSVFVQGSFEHWNQLRDDLERLINQLQCVEPGFGTTLVALLTDARGALDAGKGKLAKAGLQRLLSTLARATGASVCAEGRELVQLNAEALIANTPDNPISFEIEVAEREIDRAFPGYRILARHEFSKQIQTSVDNPAIVMGRYSKLSGRDFAALVRSSQEKSMKIGENSHRYFDGKLVICYEKKEAHYDCQELLGMPIRLPYNEYLQREEPGKKICFERYSLKNRMEYEPLVQSVAVERLDGNKMIWLLRWNWHFVPCVVRLKSTMAQQGSDYMILHRDLYNPGPGEL